MKKIKNIIQNLKTQIQELEHENENLNFMVDKHFDYTHEIIKKEKEWEKTEEDLKEEINKLTAENILLNHKSFMKSSDMTNFTKKDLLLILNVYQNHINDFVNISDEDLSKIYLQIAVADRYRNKKYTNETKTK
tara:strand:- start:234 stop:635 length:402 start_codon:yes stop_codon:yes gene_type:complete